MGWEAMETTKQTVMTSEHDSVFRDATSPRVAGEVWCAPAHQPLPANADGQRVPLGMVGDRMFGKEATRNKGRPVVRDHLQRCTAGVRAAIVVKKSGNAEGAKGGRKSNGKGP